MMIDGDQRPTQDEALAYLKAVKDTFPDKREKYDEFLNIVKDFKVQRIDKIGVIERVKELFKGHPGLISGFNTFLTNGHEIILPLEDEQPPQKKPVELAEGINFLGKTKRERITASNGDCDLSAGHSDTESDRCLMNADKDKGRHGSKEKNYKEERDRRQWKKDDRDYDHDGSGEHLSNKRSCCSAKASGMLHEIHPAFRYLDKVKEKLSNSEDFQEFLKYLHVYARKIITRQELQLLVGNLLGKYADLIDGLDEFVAQCEKYDELLAGVINKSHRNIQSCYSDCWRSL